MSNFVYGYIKTNDCGTLEFELRKLVKILGIGFQQINRDELYGFPKEIIPSHKVDSIYYINISVDEDSTGAGCLIDFDDYIEDVEMHLPHSGLIRLKVLTSFIFEILSISNVSEIVLAMTDCNQIESIQELPINEAEKIIIDDFVEYPPPNKIYIIKEGVQNSVSVRPGTKCSNH